LLYGLGPQSLAASLRISVDEAKRLSKSFLDAFPKVSHYLAQIIDKCRRAGFVEYEPKH